MMRRFMMLALGLSFATTHAQATWHIGGRVVSATTGQALDHADVTLSTPGENGTQVAEAMTRADGAFRFDGLQPGKYRLRASRRGYVTAGYEEHDGFATMLIAGPPARSAPPPGLDLDHLSVQLVPDAVIGGAITDEAGDPVQRAQVMLYRRNTRNGTGNMMRLRGEQTDGAGAYEFSRLEPGDYYVCVTATPWYAIHPQPRQDVDDTASPAPSPLDVAYPPTYYPGVTDSDSATAVPLKAGEHVEVSLSLHAVPAVRLTFTAPGPAQPASGDPGRVRFNTGVVLEQEVFGTTQPSFGASYSMIRESGSNLVEITGLAPGRYDVHFPGQRGEAGGDMTVNVTGNQTIDAPAGNTGVSISGKLAMASGETLPDRLSVSLRPPDTAMPAFRGGRNRGDERVGADGSFTLRDIHAGAYEFTVTAPGHTLMPLQMEASGAVVEGHLLRIASQPVTLAALVSDGETTLTGYAANNGKAASGVMMLLVPQDAKANRELFRRDQSDSDGSFTLDRVVPGTYTLVAIHDGWTLDWARPEVLAKYLSHGVTVVVPPRKSDLSLAQPVEAQEK